MILVTGANGVVGRHLCKLLDVIKEPYIGCDVKVDDRTEYCDIENYDTIRKYEDRGITHVVHLAAFVGRIHSEAHPQETLRKNLIGTMNMIDLCLRTKAVLIYSGTSESMNFPQQMIHNGIYGLSKTMGEMLVRQYQSKGLKTICLRYFMSYGPGDWPTKYRSFMARSIWNTLRGREIEVHAHGSRSWCYLKDVVCAIYKSIDAHLENQYEVVDIGSNRETILNTDLVNLIFELAGQTTTVKIINTPADIYQHKSNGNFKIIESIGWEPLVNLRNGIKETIKWQRGLDSDIF